MKEIALPIAEFESIIADKQKLNQWMKDNNVRGWTNAFYEKGKGVFQFFVHTH